jgi:hypothetical protein
MVRKQLSTPAASDEIKRNRGLMRISAPTSARFVSIYFLSVVLFGDKYLVIYKLFSSFVQK